MISLKAKQTQKSVSRVPCPVSLIFVEKLKYLVFFFLFLSKKKREKRNIQKKLLFIIYRLLPALFVRLLSGRQVREHNFYWDRVCQ